MYKVLIVDDDITVREYLRRIISWKELEFELVGDAINGLDALNKIETYNPDIIILDLAMPIMSGIELLKALAGKGIKSKVVVLSCHDDYDNVVDAMKNGALDFLLKHRMKDYDLINVLNQAVLKLEKENSELTEITRLKENDDISKHVMRKNFINDLTKGYLRDHESIETGFKGIKADFSLKNIVICVIGIDDSKNLKEKHGQSLNERIINPFQNYLYKVEDERNDCICIGADNGSYYIVLSYMTQMSFLAVNKDIYDFLTKIMDDCKREMDISITIGVSGITSDVMEISKVLNQAQYAWDCSFYKGKGKIIHYNEIQRYDHKPLKSLKEYEKTLNDSLINKPQNIPNVIDMMYSEIEKENASLDFVRDFNIDMISHLKKILSEFGISSEEVYGNACFPYKHINLLETIDELKAWLCEVIIIISDEISQRNDRNKHSEIIKKALSYIKENYMHNISLDDAATHVSLSKAYFSSFFKKELNVNFVEYLTGYRIKRARELLENTEMKVYNIALNVGIDNYRYFSKVFKEITGLTPLEYKSVKKNIRIS